MKTWVRLVLAICLGASLLLFVRATDLQKVINAIQQVGYQFILLLLITLMAYFFGTLSWQYCLGNSSRNIFTGNLFLIRHVGETVSLINPASIIVGETVKVFLLNNHKIEKNTAIASIFVSRIIMIITQLLLFTAALAVLLANNHNLNLELNNRGILLVLIVILVLAVPLMIFRDRLRIVILKTRAGTYLKVRSANWRFKMKEVRTEIFVLVQQHKKQIFLAILFAAIHWILGSLEFFFILKFLGIKITMIKALVVDMGVIFFKSAGAFIPGQIGIEEYGNKIMLAAIGIPGTEIWITASILRRARQMVWIAVGIGIYWLLFKNQRIINRNGNTVRHT